MRIIIIAAGEATRWKNYLGVPKHLITVDGETLLERSVRLFREHDIDDIHIVHKGTDARYDVTGSHSYIPVLDYTQNADADKFLSSKQLWSTEDRTVIVYGDCWLSDEAVNTIVMHESDEFTLFARSQASTVTGTPWGECFAFSVYPKDHERLDKTLQKLARLWITKVITRCGGWELYRMWIGVSETRLAEHVIASNFVEIDDWSDDFDFPDDWDRWSSRRDAYLKDR